MKSKPSTDDLKEAIPPIHSLIRKSEKAQQKLRPGTWQHKMLEENLKALHIASALMEGRAKGDDVFTQEELKSALLAFAEMRGRGEKAQAKFAPGSSQHSLQQNRLGAFRTAEALISAELT